MPRREWASSSARGVTNRTRRTDIIVLAVRKHLFPSMRPLPLGERGCMASHADAPVSFEWNLPSILLFMPTFGASGFLNQRMGRSTAWVQGNSTRSKLACPP